MAVTQYIGARYVPLFFTNPDDNSNNWKSGVAYDPLTIITDQAQSYTSKIPVPAGIGRPSENPDYWILTGAYNAQVEQYRQEVEIYKDNTDNQIEAIEDHIFASPVPSMKKVIALSDSYGSQNSYAMMTAIRTNLGLANSDYFYDAVGSIGFAHANEGETFLTRLQAVAATLTSDQIADVSHIIVTGGANDTIESASAVTTAINNFAAYVYTAFPNAKIYIGFIGYKFSSAETYKYGDMIQTYKTACGRLRNVFYLGGVEHIMHNTDYMQNDSLHPNVAGCEALADGICSALINGSVSIGYAEATLATLINELDPEYPRRLRGALCGDVSYIALNNICQLHLASTANVQCTGGAAQFVTLAVLENKYFVGEGFDDTCIQYTALIKRTSDTVWTSVDGTLRVANGALRWSPIARTSSGEISYINFDQILLKPFKITFATDWN